MNPVFHLQNPQIILLDEATSALDSESEDQVKKAIYTLAEGRTVISVAHRLSTISDYDRIYVLEKGEIVEQGTHNQLLKKKQYYYQYYQLQKMGQN